MKNALVFALLALMTAPVAAQYVVLSGVGPNDAYHAAAKLLAKHHKTRNVLRFSPAKPQAILGKLKQLKPEHVAIVVRPEQIDVNAVRRFLKMATRIDQDPFVDFGFGYITGATADEAVRFAENIIRAAKKKQPRQLGRAAVMGGKGDCLDQKSTYRVGKLEFPMRALWFRATDGKHGRDQTFIDDSLDALNGCGAIIMGGHGMPWEIGTGPRAVDVARLNLFPAVAFNYACHTGVTLKYPDREVKAGRLVHRLKDVESKRSFALSMIRAGVTGYVAYVNPRPAGPELSIDFQRVLAGATLGESRRNDYNKIVLGYLGFDERGIVPPDVKDGDKIKAGSMQPVRHMMLDAATGGILYGDPAFRPYPQSRRSLPLRTKVKRKGRSLTITMRMAADSVGLWCSDPFRQFDPEKSQQMAMKIYDRVELPKGVEVKTCKVVSAKRGGRELETMKPVWAVELERKRRWLHVKVNFKREKGRGEVVVEVVTKAGK